MDKTQLAENVTKALAYTENGGKPTQPKAGKSGEVKSIFQFEPDTWKQYSEQIFGKEVPLTPDTETHVVLSKVSKWLDEGKTPQQIASMWNAGESQGDAYKGTFTDGTSSSGTNAKYGVAFDVPGYVKKFDNYLSEFQSKGGNEKKEIDPNLLASYKQNMTKLASIADQAKSNPKAPQATTAVPATGTPGLLSQAQPSVVS